MSNIQTAPAGTFIEDSARVFKLAEFLSTSDIIPQHFQGKKANCFLALEMSQRLNINFFELVNGLFIVKGKPGFTGAFIIARINGSGLFPGGLNFEFTGSGKTLACRAWAKKEDGTLCEAVVSMAMAEKEKWTNNTKYQTMPEQMLTYRSATFFCRRFCPQILMGARTIDELEDINASKMPVKEVIEMKPALPQEPEQDDYLMEALEAAMLKAQDANVGQEVIDSVYSNVNLQDSESIAKATEFLLEAVEGKENGVQSSSVKTMPSN